MTQFENSKKLWSTLVRWDYASTKLCSTCYYSIIEIIEIAEAIRRS